MNPRPYSIAALLQVPEGVHAAERWGLALREISVPLIGMVMSKRYALPQECLRVSMPYREGPRMLACTWACMSDRGKARRHTERVTMLKRVYKRMFKSQRGITGLETAIILISFVVVASIFSYTILSAGIFSSEKTAQGIAIGLDNDIAGDVDEIKFTVASVLGQEANSDLGVTTDVNGDGLLSDETTPIHSTVITYFDRNDILTDITWTKKALGRDDGDDILEAGEKFEITVLLKGLPTTNQLVSYDTFTIELKPAAGGPVIFSKTIPPLTTKVMVLN